MEAVGPAGQELVGRNLLHLLGNLGTLSRDLFEAAQGGLPEKGTHFIP